MTPGFGSRSLVPDGSVRLLAARDWLRPCALPGTQISVGAQTHSLAAESSAAPRLPSSRNVTPNGSGPPKGGPLVERQRP